MDLQTLSTALVLRLSGDPLLYLVLVVLLITLVQLFLLSRRVSRLTRGANGASLETAISAIGETTATLAEHSRVTETALNNLDTRLSSSLRTISVRRFDPFQNAGGQQSFAAALLNEKGDGMLLSGIHARDSVRVYAKEVHNFESDRELSLDETAAVQDAKKKLA